MWIQFYYCLVALYFLKPKNREAVTRGKHKSFSGGRAQKETLLSVNYFRASSTYPLLSFLALAKPGQHPSHDSTGEPGSLGTHLGCRTGRRTSWHQCLQPQGLSVRWLSSGPSRCLRGFLGSCDIWQPCRSGCTCSFHPTKRDIGEDVCRTQMGAPTGYWKITSSPRKYCSIHWGCPQDTRACLLPFFPSLRFISSIFLLSL